MTKEIKTLLGEGHAAASGEGVALHETETPQSPTVLAVDRWTARAGQRVAASWREQGVDGFDEVSEDEQGHIAADAIDTLLSSKPTLAERPADPQRATWWKQLMENPECQALRARTVCAPAVAELAAAELATQWLAYSADLSNEPENPEDGESPEQSIRRMRSIQDALDAASQMADDAEAIGAGLGLGTETQLDAAKLAAYTRKLRQSGRLAAIMRMAGRFIAKAQRLQRQRADLPGMEITGVELSGDLARVLPVEAALVAGAVPELEMLALARLAQRRALSYKRITRTPVAMGPIVVSVDESGSMSGEKIEAAKGLALAMTSIARAQKRPFVLSAFSGTAQIRTVAGGPNGGDPDAIVAWLSGFMSGGTILDGPLHTLPTEAWPEGYVGKRADHIIITDDDVGLPDQLLAEYQAWAKQMGVRTFGIGIQVRHVDSLARVADGGVWALPSLDLNNPAVETILSIGPTGHEVRSV